MKRIKPEQKKLIVSIVAIIIVVTMIAGLIAPFVYGAENDDSENGISIEASIGFDAYMKMNRKCLYEVTVKNNSGDDIEGEVQVIHEIFAGYGTNKKEYQVVGESIELPVGSIKKAEIEAYTNVIEREITIRVADDDGKILATKKFPVSITDENKMWYADISENKGKIAYLKPEYYGIDSYDFDIDEKNLSENSEQIANIDCIVLNDFDTDDFSEGQAAALGEWVADGGIFIVGTGKNKNRVFAGLDFLNEISGGEPGVYTYGKGEVYIYDFDFADPDATGAGFQNEIVNIYNQLGGNGTYYYSDDDPDSISGIIGFTQTLKNYSDWLIFVIIIIIYGYILFISPILYLILKKLDKREAALKIIPISAAAITLFIYLLSFVAPYKKPISNVVSLIELNRPNKTAVIGINVLSPESGTVKCTFDDEDIKINYLSEDTNEYNYYSNNNNTVMNASNEEIKIKNKIINGNNKYAEIEENAKWNENYIGVKKDVVSVGDLKVNGDFNSIFDFDMENNTGYDLEDAVVIYGNEIYRIGELKNGENINLRLKEKDANEKKKVATSPYSIIKENGFSGIDSEDRYNSTIRTSIISNIYNDNYSNSSYSNSDIKIVAFNNSDILENGMEVDGKKPNMTTTNIFLYTVKEHSAYGYNNTVDIDDNLYFEESLYNIGMPVSDNIELSDESPASIDLGGDTFEQPAIYEVTAEGDVEFEITDDREAGFNIFFEEYDENGNNVDLAMDHDIMVYYPDFDEWEQIYPYGGMTDRFLDELTDESGVIKVRITNCKSGEKIAAPFIIYN
ncbi:MAG: hypothetical protein IJ736_08750 [Firmicutes bacterium]|nr:hypothetical protein [Bacillota bacterium]